MSKIVICPVKKWPGSVVLADPLTFPQLFAFEDARAEVVEKQDQLSRDQLDGLWIPGILACVEKFELQGLPEQITPATFPASPRIASAKLISWLLREITAIYAEDETIPND